MNCLKMSERLFKTITSQIKFLIIKNITMKTTKFLQLTMLILFVSQLAFGQKKDASSEKVERKSTFKHSVNTCPLGVAFGIYSVNYQYLLNQKHGLVFRVDYESAPGEYSDAKIEGYGTAIVLNYRYHFKHELNSHYVGVFSRSRIYKGEGNLSGTNFNFNLPEQTVGGIIGKRWVWNSGFNINFLTGYGYTLKRRNITPYSAEINERVKGFEEKYNFLNSFLGEFSLGYAF